MLALDSWKKIEKVDVGRRLLGAMHHGRTYILICFYISVLADVSDMFSYILIFFSDFISFSFDVDVLSSSTPSSLRGY